MPWDDDFEAYASSRKKEKHDDILYTGEIVLF